MNSSSWNKGRIVSQKRPLQTSVFRHLNCSQIVRSSHKKDIKSRVSPLCVRGGRCQDALVALPHEPEREDE